MTRTTRELVLKGVPPAVVVARVFELDFQLELLGRGTIVVEMQTHDLKDCTSTRLGVPEDEAKYSWKVY